MSRAQAVTIVGGSLAGFSVAQSLRASGHEGAITVLGAEDHLPYDRPPLSKQVLAGCWGMDNVSLTDDAELAELEIAFVPSAEVVNVDVDRRRLETAEGDEHRYDTLVAATGLTPNTFGLGEPGNMVHVVRTVDDSLRLATALGSGPDAVVVGAGFLGLEIASTAAQLGCKVTVVEPLARPLGAIADPQMARHLCILFQDAKVELLCGRGVKRLIERPRSESVDVELSDGTSLSAQIVVLAVGASPQISWLAGAHVRIGNGIECDEYLQAADGVFAVGDVASWVESETGERIRLEHRTNAVEQAAALAYNLVRDREEWKPYGTTPYVWSDQLGHRLQIFGRPRATDQTRVVHADQETGAMVVLHGREGRVVGAIGIDSARAIGRFARLVRECAPWS